MKHKALTLALLVTLLVTGLAHANDDKVGRLMALSGIADSVVLASTMTADSLESFIFRNRPDENPRRQALLSSIQHCFSSEVFHQQIHSQINQQLDEAELDLLLQWYESDLGKRIRAIEHKANSDEAYAEVEKQFSSLLIESELLDFARRMDRRFQITDYSYRFSAYLSYAMYAGKALYNNAEANVDYDRYFQGMGSVEEQLKGQTDDLLLAGMVYTYQNLNDDELAAYELILDKQASIKLNTIYQQTLNLTLRDQAIEWAGRLSDTLKTMDDTRH